MASLSRTDSLGAHTNGGPPLTPTMSSKSLLNSQQNGKRSGPVRIDLEPIYTQLKSAVGDHWNLYRESLGLYVLGRLNQEELSLRIDPFLYTTPATVHLHNQFLAGIYSNSLRDAPETDIAPFVSAHDKATASTNAAGKPPLGDGAEQRLKTEIMALPARERHRLKQIPQAAQTPSEPQETFTQQIQKQTRAAQPLTTRAPETAPGGAFNKTNWELEIGKRFEVPLAVESNEFPDTEVIQKRMTPICYQEGLAGGPAGKGEAELVKEAVEAFVKGLLTDSFRRVRSNGTRYVQRHSFKRKLEREEALHTRGLLQRDGFGLLPCEQEVERSRAPFGVEDLRFAVGLGGTYLSQDKVLTAKLINRTLQSREKEGALAGLKRDVGLLGGPVKSPAGARPNGINGFKREMSKPMDRTPLDDALDDILNIY